MNLFPSDHTGLYTDYYELTMAQGYFLSGRQNEHSCFDYFFRSNPYNGGFLVFAGLYDLLEALQHFTYSTEEIAYLRETGLKEEFLSYLEDFRFRGTIYSMAEGEIVFPNEPLIRVEGDIIEAQLIESLLLNYINFQSLIATKAFRVKLMAGERAFIDFGLRRAQGLGSIHASRATVIGGATSTSNVLAGKLYNIPVTGTIAHSWIQSFDDELESFRKYAEFNPDSCVLLADTYNTLKNGVPNAIIVAKELESRGFRLAGIRLDSGDLAYLSRKARKMLDDANLHYVKIIASNQLNEYVLKSLNEQDAPIDIFGVGTEMITGKPDAALDGVYKLTAVNETPRMKLSENIEKLTLPGKKKVVRYFDNDGLFYRDGILLDNEEADKSELICHPHHPVKSTKVNHLNKEALLTKVCENEKILIPNYSLPEIHQYLLRRASLLPPEFIRFVNPHIYKVGISEHLMRLRDSFVDQLKT